MKIIIFKIIPALLPFLFTSCFFYNFQQPQITQTPIMLKLSDNIATQDNPIIKMNIELSNKSDTPIAVLDSHWISTIHNWNVNVFFNDSIPYYHQILYKLRISTNNDYIEIEPNNKISFMYELDISNLTKEDLKFEGKNNDFGNYRIKIVYEDNYLKHSKAISGPITSNEVKVLYKKY